jgi:S-DNA-T family DNA segregation ATPase FtsK/SpoIIIE
MPQLLARIDDSGWLTPAMADVLNPLPALPYDEAFVGEQTTKLVRVLSEAEAPVRVIGRVALPSHTLFAVQPGMTGRRGSRRQVTMGDVRAALPKVARALEADAVGVLEVLHGVEDAFGLLVRNAKHRPLVLRSLLMQPGFQESASSTCLAFGLDLEQSVVVRDLVGLPHLLILGTSAAKTHFLHAALVTLMLFSTPAELQIVLVGSDGQAFRPYVSSPHLMGRPLNGLREGQLALQHLAGQVSRREQLFDQKGTADLSAYNAQVRAGGEKPLPRMLLVLDAVSDKAWADNQDAWATPLAQLLERGPRAGLHLMMVSDSSKALPAGMAEAFGARLVVRSVAAEIEGLPLEGVPIRFVDTFLVEGDGEVTPVEQCAVLDEEIASVVGYWKHAAEQQTAEEEGAVQPAPAGEAEPPAATETYIAMEVGAEPPPPLSEAAQAIDVVMPRARALAAYLGWLSAGPLREVLGLTEQQAQSVMDQLRAEGLLEPKMALTLRYQRLSEPPED